MKTFYQTIKSDDTKIIALTGFKRSGKDTVAEYIIEGMTDPVMVVRFAQPIIEISKCLGFTKEEMTEAKERVSPIVGVSWRTFAQRFGTEFMRGFNDEIWISILESKITKARDVVDTFIIPDCRFDNEALFIKENDGIIIKVVRTGCVSDGHASEKEIDPKYVDYVIENNGSKTDLQLSVDELVGRIMYGDIKA